MRKGRLGIAQDSVVFTIRGALRKLDVVQQILSVSTGVADRIEAAHRPLVTRSLPQPISQVRCAIRHRPGDQKHRSSELATVLRHRCKLAERCWGAVLLMPWPTARRSSLRTRRILISFDPSVMSRRNHVGRPGNWDARAWTSMRACSRILEQKGKACQLLIGGH